jgi:2-phosphoglycerate kinase
MNNPHKIFIYGVPGAGKTTLSVALRNKLGYPLVEADHLREAVAQKAKTETEDPFAYVGTTEAFRKFGALTEENIIKGLKAVRASMAPYVAQEVAKYPGDLIMEAAFLDPHELKDLGRLVLVMTSDEEKHRWQYFEHREKNEAALETFRAARMLQDFFVEEAKELPVAIVENRPVAQ